MSTDLVPTRTGEALVIAEAPTDQLADALDFLKERIRGERDLTAAVEVELASRLKHENCKHYVAGPWKITALSGRTREWDAAELEGVLEDLVARGVISPTAAVDVIQRTVKVSGTAAMRLAGNLDGADRAQLEGCATWRIGKPSVKVEPAGDVAA